MSASPDLPRLARGIRSLRGPLDHVETARRAVALVRDAVPDAACALTWLASATDASPQVVAVSDSGADRLQRDLLVAGGPTRSALDQRRTVRTADDEGALLAVPLAVEDRLRGAVTVHSASPLDDPTVEVVEVLASAIAVALDAAHTETTLSQAMETRGLIGQAQGILMERFDIDGPRAFDVLRRVSQHRNVKLNRIAEETVTTRSTPGLDETIDQVGLE